MNMKEAAEILIAQGGDCNYPKVIFCTACPISRAGHIRENSRSNHCSLVNIVNSDAESVRIAKFYLENQKEKP